MPRPILAGPLAALSLLATAGAHAQAQAQAQAPVASPPLKTGQTAKGAALVDEVQMTLYVFAKDTVGKSVCNDQCARNWPPVTAADEAKPMGDYAPIIRADGARQWAFKGRPLYRFSQDNAPGDANGDGFLSGAWSIAAPN